MAEYKQVRLDALLDVYSVGSGDWSWDEEYTKLIDQPGTRKLLDRIRAEGIREPILLGTDGRVWDGHHRIIIAMHIGIDSVPVEFAGKPGALAAHDAEVRASVVAGEPEGIEQFTIGGEDWILDMEFATAFAARDFIKRNPWAAGKDAQVLRRIAPSWVPVEQEGE